MSTDWVNIAQTGDPNGAGLPERPAFTAASPRGMVFGASPGVRPVQKRDQLEALDADYAWRRDTACIRYPSNLLESPVLYHG